MTVRLKMVCSSIQHFPSVIQVEMSAVYSTTDENKDFCDATPSGSLRVMINKDRPAATMFEPGKAYYLDFTEAP